MFSILILTKNEEQDLQDCLSSVKWCDDIHIFDSFSLDKTVEIAKINGASVTQNKFEGYASQRNAALTLLSFKYDWVFLLDADERLPEHLEQRIKKVLENAKISVNGFRLRRRDYFGNTWLKHAQISPYYIRLIRKGKASYHREINEVLRVEGKVEDLDDYFIHFPFSKGIRHWIEKHNVYSSMEAVRWFQEQNHSTPFSLKIALFNSDFNTRRYHQKGIFYKMPGRPIIKWFYMMFVRMAILDGRAGIIYSTLQSIYEYFIVLKTKELKDRITQGKSQ